MRIDHKSQKISLQSHSCALSMRDGRRQKIAIDVDHKAQSERMKNSWRERDKRVRFFVAQHRT